MGKTSKHPNNLKALRERVGLTQDEAAARFGLSKGGYVKIEDGDRGLKAERILKAAEVFGVRPEEVYGKAIDPEPPAGPPNARLPVEDTYIDPGAFKGPRNVPVLGTGSGGEGSDFRLNGQTVDHAPRPPGIANRQDVYVIYLDGDSIEPAYMDGSPIYVDPHRRPKPKDYVVVELWGESDDEPGEGYVKRLVARRGGKLYLEQHNPPKQLDPIPEEDVKRCHRVIPWPELIGI